MSEPSWPLSGPGDSERASLKERFLLHTDQHLDQFKEMKGKKTLKRLYHTNPF